MSKRAWAWGVPAVGLVLAALSALYASTTPRYAVYRLGTATDRHDVAGAEHYFDVERIADAATEVIVADYLARQPAPTGPAEALGREIVARMAKRRLRPEVLSRVRAEIRRSVERSGMQSASMTLPGGLIATVWSFELSPDGPDVWVVYRGRIPRGPTRFRMSRHPDRSWRITEFDPDWVRRQARGAQFRLR
jgi:hypothetical protein